MDLESWKTWATVAAALIALVSLSFNYYQYRQNRNFKKKDEIRKALNALRTKLAESRIVTFNPARQNWLDGFPSLVNLRATCAAANTLVENSALPPQPMKTIVSTILEKVKAVLSYQDSFSDLRKGRDYLSRADYEKWKHKAVAEDALHDLQLFIASREQALRDFVRELDA